MAATIGALVLGAGCSPDPSAPTPLDAQEIRLVEEVLRLMEIRIERARDPERAEAEREALEGLYSAEELDILLDQLAVDPRRAQLFMDALKDSLDQRRLRLFPPQADPNAEQPGL